MLCSIDLDFADDMALLENQIDRAQQQLNSFGSNATRIGLIIHGKKTVLCVCNPPEDLDDTRSLEYNGEKIERVEDFKYLGSYIGSTAKDLDARIALTWGAFDKLRPILTSSKLDKRFRMRLFNASCISILLYGCESWTLDENLKNKVDVFVRKIYRIMLNIRQSDAHMTNKELYTIAGQ